MGTSFKTTLVAADRQRPVAVEHRAHFRPMRVPLSVKVALRSLSACSHEAAARFAMRLFLSPPRQRRMADWEAGVIGVARVEEIDVGENCIRTLIVGESTQSRGTVVLVHGWGGRGTSMGRFVSPLREFGYRVVMFDAPGHGDSPRRPVDGVEMATAIAHLCRKIGKVDAVVAHSYGAASTLLANAEFELDVGKLVLIGCYASAIEMTELFGRYLSLRPSIVARLRELVEERLNYRWTWEQVAPLELIRRVRAPTMLIHDEDDTDILPDNAERLAAANANVRLLKTRGFGHRRILHAGHVAQAAAEFIAGTATQAA